MYKLILVDDEPWILKDMEQIVDWEALGFQIVAKLNDVHMAESLLKRQSIDVVISDIRMPGKSGLDLLSFVNRVSPHTLMVFMSAYSEFSYAKKALELGCFAYLLKPVNEQELQDTLNKCSNRLAERDRDLRVLQTYHNSMLFLEMIEKGLTVQQVSKLLKGLGVEMRSGAGYAFAIVKSKTAISEQSLLNSDRLLQEHDVAFFRAMASPLKWTYLLSHSDMDSNTVKSLYKRVLAMAAEHQWDVGISVSNVSDSQIAKYYNQANMMADTSSLNRRIGVYRYRPRVNAALPSIMERIGKAKKLEHLEAALFDLHRGIAKDQIHLSGLAEIYNFFVVVIKNFSSSAQSFAEDSISVQDLVLHYGNPHDLLVQMRMLIDEHKKKPPEVTTLPIVEEIIKDIERRYAHKISLKEFAQQYFISPNYLSHLFKQEKGQSFIHFLIQKRLDAAITLLKEDISLYEVGKLVGYEDYAHFSKLFKKHLGQSPLEYKQSFDNKNIVHKKLQSNLFD
ncbi:response regulator transcription factor [Paenibacillus eucommiae]|uniref:YesN/AraC family two-component response regulator n=1 Tax=Paenibacillus eucommiae TaxID=1355755 RepID=A0ABS4IZV6_9BACL|nr:response regulator [Paenibacillus eucommiae]MBP1993127.1 YesN/AraC family two-component response regulator [Paenibacillus eucommiae]